MSTYYHFGFFMRCTDKQQALREANKELAENTSDEASESAGNKRVSFLAIERGKIMSHNNTFSEY